MKDIKDCIILINLPDSETRTQISDEIKRTGMRTVFSDSMSLALGILKNLPIDLVITDDSSRKDLPQIPVISLPRGQLQEFFDPKTIRDRVLCNLFPPSGIPGRIHRRFDINQEVLWELSSYGSTLISGRMTNVSRQGAFVASKSVVAKPGEVVHMEFHFENEKAPVFRGLGIVRWMRNQKNPIVDSGFGVEFVALDGESQAIIGKLCSDSRP